MESAVVVEVAKVGRVVDDYRRILDPSAALGMPAHVTLLYPFIPPQLLDEEGFGAIARALSGVRAFEVIFRHFLWFGEKVLWLVPEPDELQIVSLLAALRVPPWAGDLSRARPWVTR